MKTNLGIIDRVLRVLIAVAVVILYLMGILSGTLAIVLLILSGILILTSIFGFCPIYFSVGLKTLKSNKS